MTLSCGKSVPLYIKKPAHRSRFSNLMSSVSVRNYTFSDVHIGQRVASIEISDLQ